VNAPRKLALESADPGGAPDRLCLLVVEDNDADAYLIHRVLQQHPSVGRIVRAADGVAALEMIERGEVEPDLAFIDLHMPRKNGFELLVALASRRGRSFPMVVLTSSNGPTDIIRSRLRGAVQVISKPDTAAQLAVVVTGAVDAVCALGPYPTGEESMAGPGLAELSREFAALRVTQSDAGREIGSVVKMAAALRSAAGIALVGGWEMDFISELTSLSPELRELLGGSPPPEMPISDALLFWLEADRAAFVEALDEVVAYGRPLTFEGRTLAADGATKWWRLLGEPDLVGDRCVGLRGTAQDITRWRASEARGHAASEAVDFLVTRLEALSHDVRTPLNGVMAMAQVMARGDLSGPQRQHLEVIAASGEVLLELFDDLMDASLLAAGKLKLHRGVVDAQWLADRVRGAFQAQSRGKSLILNFAVAPSATGLWVGDAKRLRQVVQHLVSNAVKFTDRGSVTVEIACTDARLTIRVSDTGAGIAAEKLPYVFDRFVQADGSLTGRYEGSGRGLTICRDLLALMGGDIKAESTVGTGTVITASLPAVRAAFPAPDAETAAPLGAAPELGLRVLAAEDNSVNRLVLKTLLGAFGLAPVIVEDGRQAVEAWQSGVWDVLLMDIQMPVMDGLEAVRAIRAAELAEGRRRTPIIAVTANATPQEVATYVAAGMDGCIPKPIDPALLFQTMEDVVEAGPPASTDDPSGAGETTEGFGHRLNVGRLATILAAEKDEGRRRHLMLLLAEERARPPGLPVCGADH
jgi:signal transduction histidine kinase/DNA-binding response OmpR family regulator